MATTAKELIPEDILACFSFFFTHLGVRPKQLGVALRFGVMRGVRAKDYIWKNRFKYMCVCVNAFAIVPGLCVGFLHFVALDPVTWNAVSGFVGAKEVPETRHPVADKPGFKQNPAVGVNLIFSSFE